MKNNAPPLPLWQRFLAIDFGTKWIGLAVGNRHTQTVSPLPQIKFSMKKEQCWKTLQQLIHQWQIEALLVGFPTQMDGTSFWITQQVKQFCKDLKKNYGLPIILQDERLSTCSAKEELFSLYGAKGLTKARIDSAAAALLLESYFSQLSNDS